MTESIGERDDTMNGTRRAFLATAGVAGIATITGCSGESNADGAGDAAGTGSGGASENETVLVGPDGALRFDPEAVSVSTGTTVAFSFESSGHNVTSEPGASDECENPDGAEAFASYEGDDHFEVVERGSTYEHSFETPGRFVYVCTPHAGQGMIGEVTVE